MNPQVAAGIHKRQCNERACEPKGGPDAVFMSDEDLGRAGCGSREERDRGREPESLSRGVVTGPEAGQAQGEGGSDEIG